MGWFSYGHIFFLYIAAVVFTDMHIAAIALLYLSFSFFFGKGSQINVYLSLLPARTSWPWHWSVLVCFHHFLGSPTSVFSVQNLPQRSC
jgi:hypothetical protein